MKNPEITITMEDGGVIRAELYPEVAPNTVKTLSAWQERATMMALFSTESSKAS